MLVITELPSKQNDMAGQDKNYIQNFSHKGLLGGSMHTFKKYVYLFIYLFIYFSV